jgi:Lon-like protease
MELDGSERVPLAAPPRRRWWRLLATVSIAAGLLIACFTVPVPFLYGYLPGPVRDVEKLVTVGDAKTYSSEGKLLLTTVNVDVSMTFSEILQAAIDPDESVVLKSQVVGNSTLEELQQLQEQEMEVSKRYAREVVLRALGMGRPEGDGAKIVEVQGGSPASGIFQPGDIIVSVDGTDTETICDVAAAIAAHSVGEEVTVTVDRSGRRRSLSLRTARNPMDPSSAYLGILMRDVNYRFEPGLEVTFKTGRIAGPSAGLMFSLALYDRLTPGDLTAGRAVAGTGTIDCDGGVGPIGGIEQKIAAAQAAGADFFLSPDANAAAARRSSDDIEIIQVSSFAEAVDSLQGLE